MIYKAGAVGKNVHVLVRGLVAVYSVERLSVARKMALERDRRGFTKRNSSRNTGMVSFILHAPFCQRQMHVSTGSRY